jgi:hypothetical protein
MADVAVPSPEFRSRQRSRARDRRPSASRPSLRAAAAGRKIANFKK